jgi:hypothetical protein
VLSILTLTAAVTLESRLITYLTVPMLGKVYGDLPGIDAEDKHAQLLT